MLPGGAPLVSPSARNGLEKGKTHTYTQTVLEVRMLKS